MNWLSISSEAGLGIALDVTWGIVPCGCLGRETICDNDGLDSLSIVSI